MVDLRKINYLLAVDPSLGRLDYESLPDQTLMEMLVEDLNSKTKEDIQDPKETSMMFVSGRAGVGRTQSAPTSVSQLFPFKEIFSVKSSFASISSRRLSKSSL